jgi:hypothetical protein
MALKTVSFGMEKQLLDVVQSCWDGAFACAICRRLITNGTGWKPDVRLLIAKYTGLEDFQAVKSVSIDLICGPCLDDGSMERRRIADEIATPRWLITDEDSPDR